MTKSIVWLIPDRGSERLNRDREENYLSAFRKAGAAAGIEMLGVRSAEAVDVVYAGTGRTRVYLDGSEVTPADTIFLTDLFVLPHQVQDTWTYLSLATVLRQSGFYLPMPPEVSALVNDKVASVLFAANLGLPVYTSVRLTAGRDFRDRDLDTLTRDLSYPIAVKPASWARGAGFNVAHDPNDLAGLVSLASGTDTSLVLQPCVDADRLTDYRVVCIDGEPVVALARKTSGTGRIACLTEGGTHAFESTPAEIVDYSRRVAGALDVPCLAVDFFFDGDQYTFSEMELAGMVRVPDEPERAIEILRDQLLAFGRAHDRWMARDTALR